MNIEEILEKIDDMLDAAWAMPLSGGKVVVDAERMRNLIDAIRANMPSEIRQAKAIVVDRTEIINTAKKEAEGIIRTAEERREHILSREEIVVQAQEKANEIQIQTQKRARDMRKTAQEFTDDLLRQTEETLTQQIAQVRQARQSIRNAHPAKTVEPSEQG
ncbi:MAG: ATPase [Ruminococcaceae bacterium]|nr:ATPase [Oscillospiraceae bacterium]